MPYRIGKPVAVRENLRGTDWYITELKVVAESPSKVIGEMTLENNRNCEVDTHDWIATYKQGKGWIITGDGARMQGQRMRANVSTFPFSLLHAVNTGVVSFLADWLTKNHALAGPSMPEQPDAHGDEAVKPLPQPDLSAVLKAIGLEIVVVNVAEIVVLKDQPRHEFDENKIHRLVESLKQEGQTQLIVVSPLEGVPGKKWKLTDGERRYRAALKAGERTLIAIVRRYKSDDDQFWAAFVANSHREGYSPYDLVLDVKRSIRMGKSVREICIGTGYKPGVIYRYVRLQKLDPSLVELMKESVPPNDRIRLATAVSLSQAPLDKQLEIWEVAKHEDSVGMRSLVVKKMTAQYTGTSGARRGRKPSDNAARVHRIVATLDTDLKFLELLTAVDIFAVIAYSGTVLDTGDKVVRFRGAAKRMASFAEKLAERDSNRKSMDRNGKGDKKVA